MILGGFYAVLMLAAVVGVGSAEIANLYPHEKGKSLSNIVTAMSIMLYVFLSLYSQIGKTKDTLQRNANIKLTLSVMLANIQ